MGGPALLPFLYLATHGDAPALFDDTADAWLSYQSLGTKVDEAAHPLRDGGRSLILCCPPKSIEGVIGYLAAARAGHAIALADPAAPNLDQVALAYEPEWIIAPATRDGFEGYEKAPWPLSSLTLWKKTAPQARALHPDFYLMLLTSGSTGSSKGVRLSYYNLASNTGAIITSLDLTSEATALAHMPLSYSFGLSILHTQLAVGGRVVLTEESLMSGALWELAREQNATLFGGVPYHYEMLMRLGLARLKVPALTTFLQAGGKMQVPLTQKVLEDVQQRGGQLFIMYGQTEASPRISCFPLHRHPEKIGSSGKALDGGWIELIDDEIIYSGPNVMMGHATCRADLALGDVMGGRLATGDLGTLDPQGFVTITGRKQRFAKLFGQRVALDDLEKIASPIAFTVAVEHPEKVVLLALNVSEDALAQIKTAIVEKTKLPAPWIEARRIDEMPHTPNGKIDYQKLQAIVSGT